MEKKLYVIIILLILLTIVNYSYAQTKVGFKAGITFSNVQVTDFEGNKEVTSSIPGSQFGLTIDISLFKFFSLQPTFQYSNRGFKQDNGALFGSTTGFKTKVSYIEVPVNIVYNPKIFSGRLLLGAGPYVGFGTGGTWESESNPVIGDVVIDNKGNVIFKNDSVESDYGSYNYGKPFDYGMSFLVGYELFERYSIQLNSQIGLANLRSDFNGVKQKGKIQNTSFGVNLGFKF